VYIKFRLTPESQAKVASRVRGDEPTYLLAWTTTPWTLPGNTALAVDPEADYAVVAVSGERLILASALVGATLDDETGVVGRLPGSALASLHYEPLFKARDWGIDALGFDQEGRLTRLQPGQTVEKAYAVIAADFVSLGEGTGIVHMAPAFGAEDFDAGKAEGLLFVQPVDLRGNMTAPGTAFDGLFVKDADGPVLDDLKSRGLLLRRETIRHTYPFCWRCDTPLLYYAKPTWYIRTTAVKDRLVALNQEINWYPSHIREGRFGNWLENNIDWAASRERFWGIPIPIWRCEQCGETRCIGSLAELREAAPAVEACAACRRCWTSGSTRAPCPTPSGTILSRTPRRSARASRPTSSPRRWTRRAAGSTPFTPSPSCSSIASASATLSAWS
jgi:isoleucyl-tRNA synthetase